MRIASQNSPAPANSRVNGVENLRCMKYSATRSALTAAISSASGAFHGPRST